jgi:hypothetical protein
MNNLSMPDTDRVGLVHGKNDKQFFFFVKSPKYLTPGITGFGMIWHKTSDCQHLNVIKNVIKIK